MPFSARDLSDLSENSISRISIILFIMDIRIHYTRSQSVSSSFERLPVLPEKNILAGGVLWRRLFQIVTISADILRLFMHVMAKIAVNFIAVMG